MALVLAHSSASAQRSGSLVVGSVVDHTGRLLLGVDVRVAGLPDSATTNSAGVFSLGRMAPGPYTVLLRKRGFRTRAVPTEVFTTDTTSLAFQLEPGEETSREAQTLPSVVVSERAAERKLTVAGFYERRRFGLAPQSQFVTRADIERRSPLRLSDMMSRMSHRAQDCVRGDVYVDGVLTVPPGTLTGRRVSARASVDFIHPGEVEGMEVYAGAQIPTQYNMTRRPQSGRGALMGLTPPSCVILIWTR
jgi:hypothetical protein